MSAAVEEPHWPPRSPLEVFLGSPSARRRAMQRQDRISPSPSPLKRSATIPDLRRPQKRSGLDGAAEEDEDDEDEETLQLRLATLEARLKLKKLQSKKAKAEIYGSDIDEEKHKDEEPAARAASVLSSRRGEERVNGYLTKSKSSTDIQVPASPERRPNSIDQSRSPGRVLLGIDKGLKGKNVSLKTAPSLRRNPALDDPFRTNSRQNSTTVPLRISDDQQCGNSKTKKSFSERIAESRQNAKDEELRKKRAERLRTQRSTGFGIDQQELERLKTASNEPTQSRPHSQHSSSRNESGFSREEVLRAVNKPAQGLLHRSNTVSGFRNSRRVDGGPSTELQSQARVASFSTQSIKDQPRSLSRTEEKPSKLRSTPIPEADSALFESFSSINLSKRVLPHSFLKRTLESKTPVLIPDLLRSIKSPSYHLPSALEESDYVVFGIIASKSAPIAHKDAHLTTTNSNASSLTEAAESEMNARGKYMVLTLTDLSWTLDLFLFTTAYTRFWKLTPGTLIAILNPNIMPPPKGREDTGRFSLALNSSDDTVLEIGTAKDLGFCKAVKKDGKPCESWVDTRHTNYCEWHINSGVERMRRGRMEVQGMSVPFGPNGKRGLAPGGGGKGGNFPRSRVVQNNGLLREGAQYDPGTQTKYFIAPSTPSSASGGRGGIGASAASLLDVDESLASRGMTKAEIQRKRLANQEKESAIAKRLGEGGNGMGSEYLRLKSGLEPSQDPFSKRDDERPALDAGELGLLGNRAGSVQLSPLKRKRIGAGIGVDRVRKKTRFVTDRGIKVAGRESLGVNGIEDGGEDDELEIV
ncbi:MAG: hypothetical protein MMC33_006883 [Icmadophila ericetorum]|nr:hypothetical protein [Icmadophila ericetorum]